jgi:hypothetical protein
MALHHCPWFGPKETVPIWRFSASTRRHIGKPAPFSILTTAFGFLISLLRRHPPQTVLTSPHSFVNRISSNPYLPHLHCLPSIADLKRLVGSTPAAQNMWKFTIHQKRVAFYKDFIDGEMTSQDPLLAPCFCTLG